MQTFAFDEDFKIISASLAEKKKDYICPECGSFVRKRVPKNKNVHFYHTYQLKNCRQKKKNHDHRLIQELLSKKIQHLNPSLEHHFKEISRIADIYIHEKGLVFEIQCSKISKEEIQKRENDYQSLGLQVIWILNDKIFNKKNISDAETLLRSLCCYYTDGICFYDQAEVIEKKKRTFRSTKFLVELSECHIDDTFSEKKLYFSGDITDKKGKDPQFKMWLEDFLQKRRGKKRFSIEPLLLFIYKKTHNEPIFAKYEAKKNLRKKRA